MTDLANVLRVNQRESERPSLSGAEPFAAVRLWVNRSWHHGALSFWAFQFAVWGTYFIVRSALAAAMGTTLSGLGVRVCITGAGLLLTYGMWWVLHVFQPSTLGRQIATLFALSFVGALLLGAVEILGQNLLANSEGYEKLREKALNDFLHTWAMEMGWQSFLNLWVLVAWSGVYLGVDYAQRFHAERLRTCEAESLAHQAQLKMLRYQLNPHFLFNTLNALSALVLTKETGRAEKMILALSKFLRHTLDSDPLLKVPLWRELWAIGLYLDIEKERFSDRLHVMTDVAPDARQCMVPSLLLQPLIENALKYAIAPSASGGTITVSARREGEELVLSVRDTGPGMPEPLTTITGRRGGVGLHNTVSRLENLYEGAAQLDIKNLEPFGLEIIIRLPAHLDDTEAGWQIDEEDT